MQRAPPVAARHTRLSLVFHRRFEADAGHAWLRRLILAVARGVEPAALVEGGTSVTGTLR